MNSNKEAGMGIIGATSISVGTMVSSGILIISSSIAIYGGWGLLGWISSAFCAVLLGYSFSQMSRSEDGKKGIPVYVSKAFKSCGSYLGFQTSWDHWSGLCMGCSAVSIAFATHFVELFPFHVSKAGQAFLAISLLWLLILGNCRSSVFSVGMITAIAILKVIIFSSIFLFSIPNISLDKIMIPSTVNVSSLQSVFKSMPLALFAFLGLESATSSYESVKNPERTVPLATILGVIIAASLFIGMHIAVMVTLPQDLQISSAKPVYDTASILMGKFGSFIVLFIAVLGLLGGVNGLVFISSYIMFSSASSGWVSARINSVNKNNFPVPSSLLTGALVTATVLSYYYGLLSMHVLINLTSFMLIKVYIAGVLAHYIHSRGLSLFLINMFSCVILLLGCSLEAVLYGSLISALGLIFYLFRPSEKI
ncbi:APC family permease [Candidatus Nesciobacter abundans]|uniref:APC family permease n=1 Tax=Candidatus Nesciobacter abundans TaxID=2601668 RepID=A0A5C0UHP4_9PROT|nr:APC family permease [Candidatus Nesciobacter abundans]QEK38872.1 APC family permease [Candidatus Nesciobacter abundans]